MADLATRAAGRYLIEINTGTSASPTWTKVHGLTSYEPSFDVKTEDDTDIDSDGWTSEAITGNGFKAAFEGLVKGDDTGGVFSLDPGLQALIEAAGQADSSGHVHMRHRRKDGVAGRAFNAEFFAAVKAGPKGGKTTELQKFSGDLMGRGEPTELSPMAGSGVFAVSVGAASAGNFTLTYRGNTTANIAYNAAASAVKSALVALDDGFAAADWTVTGTAPDWTITTPDGGEITGSGTGLTGGSLTVTEV